MTSTPPARRLVAASELAALTAVLLLASLSLRIWGLTREPAWLDEVYTVQLSEGSWTHILETNAADVHPPTYYLGLRQWRQAFGSELATLRGYSVAWSLFLSLFYFTHGIVEAYSDSQARWLALTEVALALCWIVGGILFIRASKRAAESP